MRTLIVSLPLALASIPLACGQISGPVTPTAQTPAAKGWKAVKVVSGLEHPWAIAFLPDGAMLITERPGRLRIVRDGVLDPTPIRGVPEVLAQRQGGLLDVALHPDFAKNQLIYLSYSAGAPNENRTTIARARLAGGALEDLQVIFEASPTKAAGFHFGSRFLFLPDGSLLLSVGDGFNYRDQAQDVGSHLGKVLRIRDDGTTATGNPFHARGDASAEVYTYGHRNIQGLARDPVSGRIYATEHGPRGGDELNLITPGSNYGWPRATYGREYHGPKISDHTSLEGMVDPLVVWTPCIAPSGLIVYTGDAFPAWKGDIFAGGLVLRQIRRVDLNEAGEIVGQETLQLEERVRDVDQGPDGMLYVVTDEERASIWRIEPQ